MFAGRGWRRENKETAYLDDGFAANEVSAAPDGDASAGAVHHLLTSLDQLADVREPRRAVCVREQRVLAPDVAQAVGDTAALATILLESDDTDHIVQVVLPRKV